MTTPSIDPALDRLRTLAILPEHRFRSDIPLIGPLVAWFRRCWNGISTRWYVLPLAQQQSEFNLLVAARLSEHSQALQFVADVEAVLAGVAARLSEHSQALQSIETRLVTQEAYVRGHSENLVAHEVRLAMHESTSAELAACSEEHDTWLLDQDREEVTLIRDQAEITARLIQMGHCLDALERRLSQLESPSGQGAAPHA